MFVRTPFDVFQSRITHPPTHRARREFDRRLVARQVFLERLEDRLLMSFDPGVIYTVVGSPQAIVTADFNNDGRSDLATANYVDNSVSILLGNADGTFLPALTSATGANPLSLAVGDFNEDGKLDLATANTGDVSVLLGNGNGTFGAPTNIGIGSTPASVAVGDFNADGRLDLGVTSNVYTGYYGWYGYYGYYNGYANVLLGNGVDSQGDGTFAAPIVSWAGSGYHTSAVVADFNGDGKQDFASANLDYSSVTVQLGDDTGTLGAPTDFGTGYYPQSVAAGDVDGDSVIDLVTANLYDNTVSVLLGIGDGTFATAQNYATGSDPTSVVLGDFNEDGKLDIATANSGSNDVSVLYGRDGGTFSPPVNSANPGGYALVAGDFNGDGYLDAATANPGSDDVSVLLNDQDWPAAPATLSIDDVEVTEGNSGTVAATFTVTRSGEDLSGEATVTYSTANGGALAGSDYVAVVSGTVTFAPGVATQTITILVNGDLTDEYDQGFFVNLSAPAGAIIADGQGFATILDNDDEPTIITITPVSKKEGNRSTTLFIFFVTLSAASEKDVWVDFETADGTATTADGDYISQSGTLYFAPGVTSQTISILVKGDKKRELNEKFYVNLISATNASIGTAQGIGEILDDDAPGGKGKPGRA